MLAATWTVAAAWHTAATDLTHHPSPDQPVIRVQTELVVLHASVRDRNRRAVADLPCEAFRVHENGVPQELSICEPGSEPMALGLVLDSSTSMARYKELLAVAGEEFVRMGNRENQVFVLYFNERVRSAFRETGFTSDPREVADAVRASGTRGMTALHDAIDAAIDHALTSDRLKKVVVLVSDGGDNASASSFDRVLDRAMRTNVTFFAIALWDHSDRDADPGKLQRLARETGGVVFRPERPDELRRAFGRIAQDLQSGYTLAYVSKASAAPGAYRSVKVEVDPARGRDLAVRTRAGYVATGETGAVAIR
jgi:Ca-activated chloride channel family protein